ncbi:hypothetical protein GE09DRAFT_1165258 [Coniochaeta sp. 2T2.1]|nr:hypothetical protein GE09DRAFT_1165258 [Coniochaeta sp. 2T2.1]
MPNRVAAPAYFRPKHIEGVGVLQDAGVLQKNPITMVLSELHAVYPHIDEAQYLVSLGSGSTRSSEDRQDQLPGILDSNFIVRLFRAHMSLVKNIFIVRLFRAYMSPLGNNFIVRLFRAYMSLVEDIFTVRLFRVYMLLVEHNFLYAFIGRTCSCSEAATRGMCSDD